MIKHWNRSSRETVKPPALELLKTQTRFGPEQPVPADGALTIGLDYRPSETPSNPNYSIFQSAGQKPEHSTRTRLSLPSQC